MSVPRQSRYHVYRTSSTKTLLIADSQARNLEAGNLNILSLPGACVRHVYNFIPPRIFLISSFFSLGETIYIFSKTQLRHLPFKWRTRLQILQIFYAIVPK